MLRTLRTPCLAPLVLSCALASAAEPDAGDYVGLETCAECHPDRAESFLESNHANSWRPPSSLDSVAGLPAEHLEGSNAYSVEKVGGAWHFVLKLADRPAQAIPIHSVIGGPRLGFSFVLEADRIEGRRLARPALVEARFMLGARGTGLRRSPGAPAQPGSGYELALGQTLTPAFAEKCLDCHGAPLDREVAAAGGPHPRYRDVGVRCERCHGPGREHAEAARAKSADLKIAHPGRLPNEGLMELCAPCHSGFFPLAQPRPDDILIANQVTALESSECYVQSRAGLSCLTCHDPHRNARPRSAFYDRKCLGCHAQGASAGVLCPVSPRSDCISCHMPDSELPGGFHVTDHWIRIASNE